MGLVLVALCATCTFKFTIDGPTRRTRQNLEREYQVVESYGQTYGRLPSPTEFLEYKEKLIPDFMTRYEMATDGWGQGLWICRHGDGLRLLSLGPNGVNDGGGVDDLSIEIDP